MPPRYAYWTILLGTAPTAFRARDREDLLPTFEQLRQKHPDAVMRWFERGRLWDSPAEARRSGRQPEASEPRGPDWRPGGEHRDPRARFKKKRKKKARPGASAAASSAGKGESAPASSTQQTRNRQDTRSRDRRPRHKEATRDRKPRRAETGRTDRRPQRPRPSHSRLTRPTRSQDDAARSRDRRDRQSGAAPDVPPRDDTPREVRARKDGTRLVRKVRR